MRNPKERIGKALDKLTCEMMVRESFFYAGEATESQLILSLCELEFESSRTILLYSIKQTTWIGRLHFFG